ncbi:MAG: ABC-F family ATP-binding cassette domain-containing protein [Oscillospiraceae bacterium]|nr:ABC-F family ATP-binding cassette domain-containing protein [Oscillospiraceae bacterium]
MLQIKNLFMNHTKDSHVLGENISFVINEGDKAALIGEEGNGKSTLLKLIYDPQLVENYMEYSGEIITNGAVFGYLSQETEEYEKEKTIARFCKENGFEELYPYEVYDIARQLCLDAEIFESERKIKTLSGGEKVKIRMAAVLAKRPDMLLLDEPSNDIDIETLEWLEDFINSCGLPVLYISHDETLLENTANMIIHMEQLRRKTAARCTVAKMPYRRYVEERLLGFEKQEQMARSEKRDFDKKMERFRQIYQKVDHQQENITRQDPHGGALLKKKMHSVKAMGRRFEKEKENLTQMPESEDAIFIRFGEKAFVPAGKKVLSYEVPELFAGEKRLCGKIKLEVNGGEKICIIGRNGTGKTTLLKKIAEELLQRKDIKTAYMPQNYEEGFDLSQNPVELLAEGGTKEERTKIRTYLGSIKFTADEMSHPAAELSGGQKAKLFFAKMALGDYNVLVLDEPTRNLSPLSNPAIREVLQNFGGVIISVSHDRKYIAEVCEKIYELSSSGLKIHSRERS